MFRGIDHLVIACPDPDAAAARLEAELGLIATGGGTHEGRGSHNRLVFLADGSYLELIGVTDAGLAAGSPVGAATVRSLEHGGGLATFALAVDDINAWTDALGPSAHGSRRRDDGELVEWWTAVPDAPLAPDRPFLIQHSYAGAEWGADAMAARASIRHPIGTPVHLARLDVASDDPIAAAATLATELGTEIRNVGVVAVGAVGPHVLRLLPSTEMAAPAVVTLAAQIDTPVGATMLGMRFEVERGS